MMRMVLLILFSPLFVHGAPAPPDNNKPSSENPFGFLPPGYRLHNGPLPPPNANVQHGTGPQWPPPGSRFANYEFPPVMMPGESHPGQTIDHNTPPLPAAQSHSGQTVDPNQLAPPLSPSESTSNENTDIVEDKNMHKTTCWVTRLTQYRIPSHNRICHLLRASPVFSIDQDWLVITERGYFILVPSGTTILIKNEVRIPKDGTDIQILGPNHLLVQGICVLPPETIYRIRSSAQDFKLKTVSRVEVDRFAFTKEGLMVLIRKDSTVVAGDYLSLPSGVSRIIEKSKKDAVIVWCKTTYDEHKEPPPPGRKKESWKRYKLRCFNINMWHIDHPEEFIKVPVETVVQVKK